MDPFLVTLALIILIGAIIFITQKKRRNYKCYGFLGIVLVSLAGGIHFGMNLTNDFMGGFIVSVLFTVVLGGQWFFLLRTMEKSKRRNKNRMSL